MNKTKGELNAKVGSDKGVMRTVIIITGKAAN